MLQSQMSDQYDDFRAAVVQALADSSGKYRDTEMQERAVSIVLKGLEDANSSVRAFAADALAEYRDPRAVGALMKILEDEEETKPLVNALLALGQIGDREAVPEIIEKTESDKLEIKETALKALGIIADPRAEDYLIKALATNNVSIRIQAAASLGKIG